MSGGARIGADVADGKMSAAAACGLDAVALPADGSAALAATPALRRARGEA